MGRLAAPGIGITEVAEYHELPDHQLLHQITLAEEGALEALYARYSTSVFSLAMFMLKQQTLAEEVTQDVFLNIWLKASSFNADRGEPRAWIMSVAHHRIIDVIRSRRRTMALTEPANYEILDLIPSSGPSTEEEVERNLDRDRIAEALSGLPEAQREVIVLAYFEGYSQAEMAKKLQQPLGTVKTRVRLAMQKLRVLLEEYDKQRFQ